MSNLLKVLVYPIVFVVSLLVFTVVLFPFDSVKNRVAAEVEKAMGGEYQISIGKFSVTLPNRASVKDVEIRRKGDSAAVPVKISQAKFIIGLFSLLSGKPDVDFDVRPIQGSAKGSLVMKNAGGLIDLKMDRFEMPALALFAQMVGVPLTGSLSGVVHLEFYPQDPLKNTGKASLQFINLGLGEISVGNGALNIPAINLASGEGVSRLEATIDRGNVDITAFELGGGDLTLKSDGKIYGARKADNYRFNLKGSFSVTPELANKIQILSLLEKQKQPDGTYPFTVTGRIGKPSIRIGDFKLPI